MYKTETKAKFRHDDTGEPSEQAEVFGDEPPRYSAVLDQDLVNRSLGLTDHGRVEVDLNSRLCRSLSILVPRAQPSALDAPEQPPEYTEQDRAQLLLNIVIQVVGSRGDVQPFIALGCELLKHGHRVRLATHDCFSEFVRKSGLEFFPIGGDPAELMAYMVKNPGLFPSMKSLRAGDIQKKRRMVSDMLNGCWRSCIEPDPVSGKPFVSEAIIANPPSFAHVHCAQALGIPVHLMFTMPWTSTKDFCHPLANITKGSKSSIPAGTANYISYLAVEWMTWQGLGDVVNDWRKTLGLEPVPFSEGPLLVEALKVPFTYCWSPALVPKPSDWPEHIDVCGFFFRDPPKYDPEPELDQFLRKGSPPVYIGFGSIVIDNPEKVTDIIYQAVKKAGVRAVVSRGWSNLGANYPPDSDVFFLGDCPHEWLFQRVAAVVHHGGAGTTACGLVNGRPTTIIPFFGDQPFWGDMVAAAGAGPRPIPQRNLNGTNLAEAITYCLSDEASTAANGIAEKMLNEAGVRRAVASFHANLPLEQMRCDVVRNKPAAWVYKKDGKLIKLSKNAAGALVEESKVDWSKLKRYDTKQIDIELTRWDPFTATTSSLMTTSVGIVGSAVDIVAKPIKVYRRPVTANVDSNVDSPRASSVASGDSIYGRSAALYPPPGSVERSDQSKVSTGKFGAAVAGSASGVGGFFKHFTKGMYLDMPLAVAEGMRVAPRLYGGEVYDPGTVRDWKSGGVVAGKNFGHGIVEGLGGLVMAPVKGARKDGAAGVAKGVGVGLLNMGTKLSSGTLGLVAFTGQGIYKSIHAATHHAIRDIVKQARKEESEYLARELMEKDDILYALGSFNDVAGGSK